MSLLDVLDNSQRHSGLGGGGGQRQRSAFDVGGSPMGGRSYQANDPLEQQAAASSRERGVPERVDINQFVTGYGNGEPDGALQALEVAGHAPGFIMERPLAVAQTALKNTTGFDIGEAVRGLPGGNFLADFAGGLADVFINVQGLPETMGNSAIAEGLRRGTVEGWHDDHVVPYMDNWATLLQGLPGGGLLNNLFSQKPLQEITFGEYKDRARARGWNEQDVKDLVAGKSIYDYGNRRSTDDVLTDTALRIFVDPTLLLMGTGAVLKIPKGVGLLTKMVGIGAELEKPLSIAASAEKIAAGEHMGATWLGLAQHAGQIGRGVSYIPGGAGAIRTVGRTAAGLGKVYGGYKKAAVATTATQLGLAAIDQATGPKSGFLESFFDFNRQAFDNQPLSKNVAFSLFSAFHMGPHDILGPAWRTVTSGMRALDKASLRGGVLDALSEGMTGTRAANHAAVVERLGGEDALNNLIYHTSSRILHERLLRNPVLKSALSDYKSFDEAALANARVKDIVDAEMRAGFKDGTLKTRQIVQSLRDWYANREGINGVEFPWDGQAATDRWVEYSAAAAPISQIFYERAGAVVGLADTITKVDVQSMRTVLKTQAVGGAVPIRTVRQWLSKYPQLIKVDPTWQQYLLRDAPESVPLKSLQGKLRKAERLAPELREITHESAVAEAAAARSDPEDMTRAPIAPDHVTLQQAALAGGGATIAVSRMRDPIKQRLARSMKLGFTSVDDIRQARSEPHIAHYEEHIGEALADTGLPVESVSQAAGLWEGKLEPSVEITMQPGAGLNELRLAAALAGKAGEQDAVLISITGARVPQLGLEPNGMEVVWGLPTTNPAALEAVNSVIAREFIGGTVNDTTGTVRLAIPDGNLEELTPKLEAVHKELEGLFPKDLIGDTGLRRSTHRAYIEFPGKEGDLTYDSILRDARAASDPRARTITALRDRLAYRRTAEGVDPRRGGSGASVGRHPGDDGLAAPDVAKPTADRVGIGARDSVVAEPGYVYRSVDPALLEELAGDGIRVETPVKPWADGKTTARSYFTTHVETLDDGAIVRLNESAGPVPRDRISGEPYARRRIRADQLEVYGNDGNWHDLSTFFEKPLPDDVAAAAASVAPAYDPVTAANFGRKMADAFNGNDEQALVYSAVGEAMANSWSSRTGRPAGELYNVMLAGIEKGEGQGHLNQIAARNARVIDAGATRELIEEPVPEVLTQHGLGGESPIEWTDFGGQQVGIPGGVEGLAQGEWTLWDLWRLKAQQINPAILPESVRVPLYAKLFRTQMRALDNPVDVFNRVGLSTLSPKTVLAQNEALLSFVRARDMGGIQRLAEIAERVEAAGIAKGLPAQKITSEIGFAIQGAVGILDFKGPGIKSVTTNSALGQLGRAAILFRDNPEYFTLRPGEDLLQYSERLMNVLPGSAMKAGNFSAMLGNPIEWDRGTMDVVMSRVLDKAGLLTGKLKERLAPGGKYTNAQGAPIQYRMADGSLNPALPEHLRDLPVDPPGNKVTVYGHTYKEANELLRLKQEREGVDAFGLGGYQWYSWDLERGKFEPHTVIYPGSHELPPIEQQALAQALEVHQELGYMNSKHARPGAVSPTRALYYQKAEDLGQWRTNPLTGERVYERPAQRVEDAPVRPEQPDGEWRTNPLTGERVYSRLYQTGDEPLNLSSKGPWAKDVVDVPDSHAPRDILFHYEKGDPGIAWAPDNTPDDMIALFRDPSGQPAGYARVNAARGPVTNVHVFVKPEFRRQGIATQLYDWVSAQGHDLSAASGKTVTAEGRSFTDAYWVDRRATDAAWSQERMAHDDEVGAFVGKPLRQTAGPRDWDVHEATAAVWKQQRGQELTLRGGGENGWEAHFLLNRQGTEATVVATRTPRDPGMDIVIQRTGDMRQLIADAVAAVDRHMQGRSQGAGEIVKGSAELLDSGQAIIRGTTAADFSTGVHELWHAAQVHIVDPADLAIMEKHYKVTGGTWLTEHHERAARDFERYLRNGVAPSPQLASVFAQMKQFLTAVYARLKGTPIEKQIHPDIKAVFDRSLSELPPEMRPVHSPDPLTVGMRAMEDKGRAGLAMDETALRARLAELTRDTVLSPEAAAEAQNVQRQLEAAILAKGERRSGQVLWNAERDAHVTRDIPLHRSLEDRPAEVRADLARLEADLRDHYGMYTLKAPPKLALFFDKNQGDLIAKHLEVSHKVAQTVANWGAFGRMSRYLDWLTAPVENERLGRHALQALYNELLPHGASTTEVRRFVTALSSESNLHSVGPFEIRAFRNGTSLTQQAINKIAAGDPMAGRAGIFSEKTIKAVGRDGFARALDRASNRWYQAADGVAGGSVGKMALARGFVKTYDAYQKTWMGSAQRYVGKTMYHWFRFLSDPRWWAMNVLEADMLGGMRYGASATRFAGAHKATPSAASLMHELGGNSEKAAKVAEETLGGADTGWLYTRRLGGYVSRAFDHERPESTLAVLRGLEKDDPVLADLKAKFGDANDDIVQGIDKMLYSWDQKGPKATLLEEAMAQLGAEETERLLPVLQKVWERHEQTYKDITQIFHGNPNRSNLERLGNSYWLYWPLSYQVKATRWLVDTMTNRFAGHNTKLLPAAMYANLYEDHKRRMAEEPEYAGVFEKNPTLWFLAQMMLPITPGDIGVSLSRPVRYSGAKLGLWGEYKSASDPVSAAGAILSLGPAYSAELMARLSRELFAKPTANNFPSVSLSPASPMGAPKGLEFTTP